MSAKKVNMERILEILTETPGISRDALLKQMQFDWSPASTWVREALEALIEAGHVVQVGDCYERTWRK